MRGLFAIARKELSIFFTTTIAYAGLGAYAFLMGLVFVSSLNQYQQRTAIFLSQQQPQMLERLNFNDAILTPMFSTGVWMFLFFVPFLTMRLLAEEKNQNTFELLMTTPISSWQIVLGKFIATWVLILVMSFIPLVFPFILEAYGTTTGTSSAVEWSPVLVSVLMATLMGSSFIALGMLMSSLTDSQIVAALLTFATLLLSYTLPFVANRLEGDWQTVLDYASPLSHVNRAFQGRLLAEDLVYFLSLTLAGLIVTQRVVESNRWR
ncbi:MAG: ABC transporter permease subunit [Myxococcota bacterium]